MEKMFEAMITHVGGSNPGIFGLIDQILNEAAPAIAGIAGAIQHDASFTPNHAEHLTPASSPAVAANTGRGSGRGGVA
ncbi:MAG: hypothetical protein WDN72_10625 [Alphaproteobacteria bacterium]